MSLASGSSKTLAMHLAERIGGLTATMEPNTRLGTKAELRLKWGVAAATLNEALRLLQSRGAVSLRTGPNGGVFVAEPHPLVRVGQALVAASSNPTAMVDALALRDVLDPLTVLEASRYRTNGDIRALRQQIGRMRETIHDDTRFAHEIWRLHRMIAGIGRNEILRAISIGLLEILMGNTQFVVAGSKPIKERERRIRVHEELVDAIESGDPRRCELASRAHGLADGPPPRSRRSEAGSAHSSKGH